MKLVDVDSIQIEIKRPRMNGKYLLTEALAKELEKALKELPAVDAVPVRRGKWLLGGKCSECNGDAPFYPMASTYYESKYCPHCGAKMDGGEK